MVIKQQIHIIFKQPVTVHNISNRSGPQGHDHEVNGPKHVEGIL